MKEQSPFEEAPENETSQELDYESEQSESEIGARDAKLQTLRSELQKVKTERQEYLDGWQRCKADALNLRKELLADATRSAERAKESLFADLVAALDSFDMAMQSPSWHSIDPSWRSGMEMVHAQLLSALESNGISRFGAIGDTFSAFEHEPAGQERVEGMSPGVITRVLRFGYRSGVKVLRPAHVFISID